MYKFKLYLKIHTVKSTGSSTQQNKQSVCGGCDYSLLVAWLLSSLYQLSESKAIFTFRTLYMNTSLAAFATPSLLMLCSLLCTRPNVEKARSTSELDATEHSKHLIN